MAGQAVWPDGVTARIPTLAGERLGDPSAVVDVIDVDLPLSGELSKAVCRCCAWKVQGPAYNRNAVLAKARAHARECRALPRPGVR